MRKEICAKKRIREKGVAHPSRTPTGPEQVFAIITDEA